jgi:hypothetical protein
MNSARNTNRRRKRRKMKTATKVLIVSVINIVWFTVAAIVLQFKTSVELSSTLITCWYTFWTCEIFAIAGIRISKVLKGDNNE